MYRYNNAKKARPRITRERGELSALKSFNIKEKKYVYIDYICINRVTLQGGRESGEEELQDGSYVYVRSPRTRSGASTGDARSALHATPRYAMTLRVGPATSRGWESSLLPLSPLLSHGGRQDGELYIAGEAPDSAISDTGAPDSTAPGGLPYIYKRGKKKSLLKKMYACRREEKKARHK